MPKRKLALRAVNVVSLVLAALLLAGCGLTITNPTLFSGATVPSSPLQAANTSVPIQGYVGASEWFVSDASVQLYAVGENGAGSASAALGQPVVTDNNGRFVVTGPYQCPSPSSQLYLVVSGGNAGQASGTYNSALRLFTLLGPCNQLSGTKVYPVDEVTTVGSIWPLSRWMLSDSRLGSSPDDPSFTAAVTNVGQLVSLAKAVSPGTGLPAGFAVQTAKLYTLASDLHSCVASNGGSAGDGSPCGQLFALTTAPGSSPPADTLEAALDLARANDLNPAGLFQLSLALPAFQPVLSSPPLDWNLDLVQIPAQPTITPSGGTYASGQSIAIGTSAPGATIHYTLDGSMPSVDSAEYAGPLVLSSAETVRAIALSEAVSSPVASTTFSVSVPHLAFTAQPSNVVVGTQFAQVVAVSVLDGDNEVVNTSASVTLQLQSSAGNATLSGTATKNAVNGVAVFPCLSISSAGTGDTLIATSAGDASATSNPFAVTAPAIVQPPVTATSLLFITQPSNTLQGAAITPPPVVEVVDASGNLVANSSAAVTLTLSGPSSALSGNTAVTAVNGIATLPGLSIATPGSAYTLTATTTGLTTVASRPFNITAPVTIPPVSAGLLFITQPSNTVQGAAITPPPVVQIVDASGNPVANATAAVTLTLTGPSSVLFGNTTVIAVNGIATFLGLSIPTPWSAYTLTATSNSLTPAISSPFSITTPPVLNVPVTILQNSAPIIVGTPAASFNITYNWLASPLAGNDTVFVHFVAADGTIAFEDDHQPPIPTSQWSGPVSYTRTVQVPASAAGGAYKIVVGLTAASGNLGLTPGAGVLSAGPEQYQTGLLTVEPTCSIVTFGAIGDGVTDNANAIQQTFNYASQHGCIALVPSGKFAYTGTVTASGIAVTGNGADSILAPLDSTNEALILSGSGVSLSNLVMVSTALTRLTTPWSGMVWLENATNYYVENILIDNSSSVGIMSYNSHDGDISNNTIENTLADSITQINGSYNITVANNRILRSGDDGISSNSYIGQPLDHDISIMANTVLGNLWGRGLEISGGSNITFIGNYVDNPDGFSDMYVASEKEWSTQGVDSVTVSGNTFIHGGPNQGTTIVYNSQGSQYNITNVSISGNTFINPPYVAAQFAGDGVESAIFVKNNTDYSSSLYFSASTDPLANVTQVSNQIFAPSSIAIPAEPAGRGCNFMGC